MDVSLSFEQQRVLGALVEKAATVPDTYPMTLKGLQAACNQRSSREPVTDLDTFVIGRTLDELKAAGLVRFVYASHGARTTKYRHVVDERLGLSPSELAVVSVLLLRGPQTVGEVRTRTERQYEWPDLDAVADTLADLAERQPPLVEELDRKPGQSQTRWTHLLGDGAVAPPAPAATGTGDRSETAGIGPDQTVSSGVVADRLADRLAGLEARVARLEAELGLG